jgi:3-dehydroquinate dehydratase type I
MKPSFVNHQKPFLTSVITEETPEQSLYAIRTSEFDGAEAYLYDLRELDVKFHTKEVLSRIFLSTDKPVMVFYYRNRPHIPQVTDEQRAAAYLLSVEAGASAVDIIGDLFDPSSLELSRNPAAMAKHRELIKEIHDRGGEAMLSNHALVPMTTAQVLDHAKVLEDQGPDMVKIVSKADSEETLVEAFKTTLELKRQLKVPFIYIAMGNFGQIHRIFGPMLGSACCFCVPYYNKDSTWEQPLLRSTRQVFDNITFEIPRRAFEGGGDGSTLRG